ncbi:MAG TPA: hypothetical protein VFV08_10130 [Puia sp.]|nr:hypothetical protein [Puia sp.]
MTLQEFNLEDVSDSESEVFEPFLDEPNNNFDRFTFKFNNALNEMLAHENEDSEESEMESYMGEYELEQDDKLNSEERDEIIPNDRFDMFKVQLNDVVKLTNLEEREIYMEHGK